MPKSMPKRLPESLPESSRPSGNAVHTNPGSASITRVSSLSIPILPRQAPPHEDAPLHGRAPIVLWCRSTLDTVTQSIRRPALEKVLYTPVTHTTAQTRSKEPLNTSTRTA